MPTTITLASAAALGLAMALLAALPSTSVLTVAARATASGFAHGAAAAAGVVVGDLLFVLAAFLGLQLLAQALGELFVVVQYAAAALLVWLGAALWRPRGAPRAGAGGHDASHRSSFLAGLLVTLGDQKAILFYLGFLPAFVDLAHATPADAVVVGVIVVGAVGGPKLACAWLADRAGALVPARAHRVLALAAGAVMVAAGVVLALRAWEAAG
ncbi:MAG: LysE family transporter [Halofilum sp. (in: g-proteobacteria)]|nr:LysE family transporter [Halofilum sp. (in: g-proteobacteria)]